MAIVSVPVYRCSFPSRTFRVVLIITSHVRGCKRSSFRSQCTCCDIERSNLSVHFLVYINKLSEEYFSISCLVTIGSFPTWLGNLVPSSLLSLTFVCFSESQSRVQSSQPLSLAVAYPKERPEQSTSSWNEHSLPKTWMEEDWVDSTLESLLKLHELERRFRVEDLVVAAGRSRVPTGILYLSPEFFRFLSRVCRVLDRLPAVFIQLKLYICRRWRGDTSSVNCSTCSSASPFPSRCFNLVYFWTPITTFVWIFVSNIPTFCQIFHLVGMSDFSFFLNLLLNHFQLLSIKLFE